MDLIDSMLENSNKSIVRRRPNQGLARKDHVQGNGEAQARGGSYMMDYWGGEVRVEGLAPMDRGNGEGQARGSRHDEPSWWLNRQAQVAIGPFDHLKRAIGGLGLPRGPLAVRPPAT